MIHSIVDEMEAEDQTAIEMEEYEGSSDNEQYSLPKEQKEHGFGNYVIEDIRNHEWEYRGNEVVQGATYPNIEAVKDAVRLWAICNTRFIKGHKPSNHIRARIKSHVYTTK